MAKKTNRPKTKTAQRRVTSVSELRASRAVDAVTPAFVDWCRETQDVPAGDALTLLGPVKSLVTAYFHASPSSEATNFEPAMFELAMDAVLAAHGDDDEFAFAFDAIHVYVEFLGETDTWTGTEEDYAAVDDLFHEDEELGLPDIVAPDLTAVEELAGLEGTALAQRMEALLEWIGSVKSVTSTGALRLKDIEAAAAVVGVAAKGAMPNAKVQQLSPENAPPGHVVTVKSMREVPLLQKIWMALDACELIDIGSTKVWPTPLTEEFLEAGHPGRLDVLREFTTKFLAIAVMGEAEWAPWVKHAAMAQSAILYAACAQAPVPVDALTDPARLQVMELDRYGALMLQQRMDELAELGLVTLGQTIAVPPAVVPAIMAVLQSAFSDDDDVDAS